MGVTRIIRQVMAAKGIKVGEIAEAVGKTPQSVSNWLYRNQMSTKTLQKVADVLGCDIVLRDRASGKIYDQER